MFANRFSHLRFQYADAVRPQAPQVPSGFVMCAAPFAAAAQQVAVRNQFYRMAYEAARRNAVPFYMRPLLAAN